MKHYDIEIHIVTPVIIQNGDKFEPFEIIPRGNGISLNRDKTECEGIPYYKGIQVPMSRMMDLPDIGNIVRKMEYLFQNRSSSGREYMEIRKRLLEKDKSNVPCRLLEKANEAILEKPFLEINRIVLDPLTSKTYLPGSSLKGAFRTAVLERIRDRKYHNDHAPLFDRYRQDLLNYEANLFDLDRYTIDTDPFRHIRFSDFHFMGADGISYIGKIENDQSIPIYSAMTNSIMLSGKDVIARGTIDINEEGLSSYLNRYFKRCDLRSLLDDVNCFYLDCIENALSKNSGKHDKEFYKLANKFLNEQDCYAIRIGHYIGIKNYTFNIKQNHPPKHAKDTINIEGGKTTRIEEDLIPGVCMLKVLEG